MVLAQDKVRVTPWYQPPEQALGADMYGPSLDIWAVGCIFAEMLTGSPLFQTKDESGQRLMDVIILTMGDICQEWDGIKHLPEWEEYKKMTIDRVKQQVKAATAGKSALVASPPTTDIQRLVNKYLGFGMKSILEEKMNQQAERRGRRHLYPVEVDIIRRMLMINPELRISAELALCHPYFTVPPEEHPRLTTADISNAMQIALNRFVRPASNLPRYTQELARIVYGDKMIDAIQRSLQCLSGSQTDPSQS